MTPADAGKMEKLGARAVRLGLVSAEQVDRLIEDQAARQKDGQAHLRLGFMMISSGLLTETQLITLLEPDLSGFRLTEDAIRLASRLIGTIQPYRTIVCTGTDKGQNTASIASQVALSIALMEKIPILLVDANLDTPTVAEMFRVNQTPGLSDIVSGTATIDEAISPSGIIGLDVMPAGIASNDFVKQLASQRNEGILDELALTYRFVLIIAPAFLENTETSILARRSDASIVVATAGESRREQLKKLQSSLEEVGSHPLGVVLARRPITGRKARRQLVGHEPIRVVQLIHTMAYGGIETILINWARSLPKVNIIPTIVCFENDDQSEKPFVDAARSAGIDVRTIPWSWMKPIPRATWALMKIIKEADAHVVHTHNVYADIVGFLAAKITGAVSVCTLYVWSDFGWKRNLLQKIDKFFVKRFDRATTQCLQTQRDTVSRGIDASQTRILKSGFDVGPYITVTGGVRNEARRKLGINKDDLLLMNVARLYPEKAQSALLKAFRRVLDSHPDSWLWILGVGPLEDQLRQEAETLGISNRVLFRGFVDNLAVWLALADIQVHPSHAEGVPLAVLSGMAAGIPVVASGVGGIDEVIRDGETGLLVPCADAPDFEDKFIASIEKLLSNPDARRNIGNAAREFVEEEYSLLSAVREIDAVYRELLD